MSNNHPIVWVSSCIMFVISFILTCLYTYPNTPMLSIEEFSVPAFDKTSDQTAGNIYFDLKLRNMNKAIGLYYDDPFSLAISYYPLEEPYQKYAWVCTVPAFYQGNGKTKHIRAVMGNNLQLPSTVMVVDDQDHETREQVETGQDLFLAPNVQPFDKVNGDTNHVRTLLRDHLQLPSTGAGNEDASQELAETRRDLLVMEKEPSANVVNFRIELVVNYRFKLWADSSTHELELGGDVMVDANTGKSVSTGSIKLVESDAVAGRPVILVVLFTSFLLIMCM